jgi:hypothetical protein
MGYPPAVSADPSAAAATLTPSPAPPAPAWSERLVLLAPLLLLLAGSLHTVWALDSGWQFAAGRWIAAHGPPSVDVLSVAGRGRPWIELRWLYCLGLYELVSHLGWGAAVAAKTLLAVAAFALAVLAGGGRRRPLAAAAVASLAIVGASERLLVRPEILSFFYLAVELALIERARRSGEARWLVALPALQVLWVNSHTEFVLGPVVLGLLWLATLAERALPAPGAAAGASEHRRLSPRAVGTALVAAVAACLLNPWGLRGLLFPWTLWRELRSGVVKDQILELHGSLAYWRVSPAVWSAAALAAVCLAVAIANRRRLDPFWTALCAAFLYLALASVRNLPLFCLVAVPFVLLTAPARPPLGAGLRRLAAAAVAAGCLWVSWQQVTDRWQAGREGAPRFGWGLAADRFPEGAADYLSARGLGDEPVFATFKESSYLLARGFRVCVDPRNEVFGEAVLRRYFALGGDPAALERTLAEWGARVAVVDLGSGLVDALRSGGRWRLVHFDAVAAVLLRYDLPAAEHPLAGRDDYRAAADAVARHLGPPRPYADTPWWRPVPDPFPYRRTAEFLTLRGFPDLAAPFLSWAREAAPEATR